jgi:hypothetical protein
MADGRKKLSRGDRSGRLAARLGKSPRQNGAQSSGI